jgi:poly(beta-D-mannuronate) lyase
MIKILLPYFLLCLPYSAFSQVRIDDLSAIVKSARPGDTILVANGMYENKELVLVGKGIAGRPVVIMAETPGKVVLSGNSFLKIAGDHLEVNGLHFTNGYAAKTAVIEFRENSKNLANNCRVTACVIDNYSRPDRFDTDSWIVMWGKNNRFDHCTVGDKLNGGTTLIVNLDDERSQQNYHSIDSNFFNGRSRLGSNGGEMIRVGVSRYSLTPSRTKIHHNLFLRCNGEVEIISIKSGENIVSRNLFVECEGGLVLRHGERNIVEGNIFLGNDKPHTGGVRVINPGHKVYNNLFVGLAGERFRSAFSVLNGVPNSALNRYFQVKDADIHHNTFINTRSIVFGAGKDAERTMTPQNVRFRNNVFSSDGSVKIEDANKDGGMKLSDNYFTGKARSLAGFKKLAQPEYVTRSIGSYNIDIPVSKNAGVNIDSLDWFYNEVGTSWWGGWDQVDSIRIDRKVIQVSARQSKDLPKIIAEAPDDAEIELVDGGVYEVNAPIIIEKDITIRSAKGVKAELVNAGEKGLPAFFIIANHGDLKVERVQFNSAYKSFGDVQSAIATSAKPMNRHYDLEVDGCEFYNFNESSFSCIKATKSTYADKVIIKNSIFRNNSGGAIDFSAEREDKGIYNVEQLVVENCVFTNNLSTAINVYRGGNDESTTGPEVIIRNCTFNEVDNKEQGCVVKLIGVQKASITNCIFNKSGAGGRSIWFEEMSWDDIKVDHCNFFQSGRIGSFHNKAAGKNIFYLKPGFIDPSKYNFNLSTASPLNSKGVGGKHIGAKLYGK